MEVVSCGMVYVSLQTVDMDGMGCVYMMSCEGNEDVLWS